MAHPPSFSSRTRWDQSTNALFERWRHRLDSGLPSTDLTETNPTRCGFDYPRQEILRALADPRSLRYEPSPKGLAAAREAVAIQAATAAQHRPSADPIDPERIFLTASTSEAYSWLFKLLCDPGDAVLIPRPSYPLFDFLADLEDVALVPYPLIYASRWRVDREALEAGIDARTRAVIVVHPNNPTGNLADREEAAWLQETCARRGLALISDEVFLEFLFEEGTAAPSLAGSSPCLTFSLGGLSKSAGLPQVKVGWIHVGGPSSLAEEATRRLEVIADTYLSVGTPAQWALSSLLRAGRTVGDRIRARIRSNRAWIQEQARTPVSWEVLHADGGWSAVLRIPRIRSEEEWCLHLIEKEGVLVHPGYFFDFGSEAYLVLSLLPPEDAFHEAMDRVLARVESGD